MPVAINPPGAKTGHKHARCFALGDANCSPKISREHFISATLLRQIQLNDTAKIAGLRWQQPEAFNVLPLKGLASNILCERHNTALSPLDAAIGGFSQTIGDFDRALHPAATDPSFERRDFCGEDLERWMLKCLIGMSVSGNIGGTLKSGCVNLLYDRIVWPKGWGLYWQHDGTLPKFHSESFIFETAVHPRTEVIMLVRFTMRGMPLALCLDKPDDPRAFGILRPSAISFRATDRKRHIRLRWSRAPAGEPVNLARSIHREV